MPPAARQGLSHVVGASHPPLLDLTIGQALTRAVERWPDAEALVSRHQNVRLTWRALAERADRFAAGLRALGVDHGDRVAIWAPNCAEWLIVQLATARAGIILVNINPAYRVSELAYTLRKVGAKALICAERFKTSDYVAMTEAVVPEASTSPAGGLASAAMPDLRLIVKIGGAARPGWLDFDAVGERVSDGDLGRLYTDMAALTPDDPINIQFTSGTTGSPKGATLSHRNILNNGYFVGLGMGLREGDRLCVPVPLYHCFGMVMSNLACLLHGATIVYPAAAFSPEAVLEAVAEERCTGLHGVPTMFIAELQAPGFDGHDLSSLRTGLMAGSPCPVEVMRQVIGRMHVRDVGIAYGMTETSPVSFQTALTDTIERRVSTIGRIQPHLEARIVDEAGHVLPHDTPGELCVRGYSVMLGYWQDPEKTAEAIDADGWMHTGDLATIDADGFARIVGRKKDMIIRGGENIYPREIEEFLHGHPDVADVQVIGVPDEKFGEEVCAWVRLVPDADTTGDDIIAFCRGQIAHYKVPRYVKLVDQFPMTVTGKVQKFEMRKAMLAEFRLDG